MQERANYPAKIAQCLFYSALVLLLTYSLFSIYVVDINKGSERDVIANITSLGNLSIADIYDGTKDLTDEMKEIILATFHSNAQNLQNIDWKEWLVQWKES